MIPRWLVAVGATIALVCGVGFAAAAVTSPTTVSCTQTDDGTNVTTTCPQAVHTATETATQTTTATVTATATTTATVTGPTQTVTATKTVLVAANGARLFGAFPGPNSTTDTSSWATREQRTATEFGGKLGVERRYQGGNLTLPAMTTPMIDSWDFPVTSTLNGSNDAAIDAIARNADKPLWLVPWHEVDNGPKISPADYISVFRYVANRVHAIGNPNVHMTTILMGYHVRGGDPTTFNQFYPGDAYVDAIGFDAYINPGVSTMDTPEEAFAEPIQLAQDHNKPLVIGETSLFAGYTDAQWTDFVGRIVDLLDTPYTDAVCWFEANKSDGDWRMSQHPNAVPLWSAVTTR